MASALGFVLGIETEVDERVVTLARFHDDVAALAAVTAGRPPARDEFFAAERHAAIASVACFHNNLCFIDKHWSVYDRGIRAGMSNGFGDQT